MATRPTPAAWEQLICATVELHLPARSRWLAEHPHRSEIIGALVAEAAGILARIDDPQTTVNPVFWASIPVPERPAEVVAIMIEGDELWAQLDAAWPNPPPIEPPPVARTESIPASAPIRRGWSPTD
jgi:hypothetical protein